MRLMDTPISTIALRKRQVIDAASDTSLWDLLASYRRHGIASLPIYGHAGHFLISGDASLSIHLGKQYIAVLTLLDCLAWLLRPDGFEHATAFQIIGTTTESRSLWIIQPTSTILECMEPMTKGVHTFLVANREPQEPLTLVSQA